MKTVPSGDLSREKGRPIGTLGQERMISNLSAQIALLAFAGAILSGLYAGNSPTTVLGRALAAMLAALLVGQLAAWAAKLALRDHLQRRKMAIDREHTEANKTAASMDGPEASAPGRTG